jgi:hypothetical protein
MSHEKRPVVSAWAVVVLLAAVAALIAVGFPR